MGLPGCLKTWAGYNNALGKCETWVHVNSEDLYRTIRTSLVYDQRRGGSRGRCSAVDLPIAGLLKGGRLEPRAHVLGANEFDAKGRCR
eukprot:8046403-Pyramimonas_sp.AAC.1